MKSKDTISQADLDALQAGGATVTTKRPAPRKRGTQANAQRTPERPNASKAAETQGSTSNAPNALGPDIKAVLEVMSANVENALEAMAITNMQNATSLAKMGELVGQTLTKPRSTYTFKVTRDKKGRLDTIEATPKTA